MAQAIDAKALAQMPVQDYGSIRHKLKSGDLLFTSGSYPASKLIQKFTDSVWSHVGIIFRVDSIDRVLLLESVEDMGVRFAPLSKYLDDYENGKPYRGRMLVARRQDLSTQAITDLARTGIGELTRPYDRDEIAKIMVRIAMGKGKAERDREYICSELVHECFERAGYRFDYNPAASSARKTSGAMPA
jgi:uncharacterized protein YycO